VRSGAITKVTWSRLRISNSVPPDSIQNIALIGFMAVGKSAVGRKLARRLKRRFVDLDKVIEKAEGLKVREIFATKGEPYFRRREKETLAEVLRENGQVIATGGGVVMDEDNLRLLKEKSFVVCLGATREVILRRAGKGRERPLLKGDDRVKRIDNLLRQREKRYETAHMAIDTSDLTVDAVVEKILMQMGLAA
jgi:shikimate kinase